MSKNWKSGILSLAVLLVYIIFFPPLISHLREPLSTILTFVCILFLWLTVCLLNCLLVGRDFLRKSMRFVILAMVLLTVVAVGFRVTFFVLLSEASYRVVSMCVLLGYLVATVLIARVTFRTLQRPASGERGKDGNGSVSWIKWEHFWRKSGRFCRKFWEHRVRSE